MGYPETVSKLFTRSVYRHPHKIGSIFGNVRMTYREINERTNAFINAFRELGVQKGDRITILSQNCHKYIEVFYAAAKGGFCLLPANWRFGEEELIYILQDSASKVIILQEQFIETVIKVAPNCPNLKHKVVLEGNTPESFLNYDYLLETAPTVEPNIKIDPKDLYLLVYTSGTTGRPKGVMLSHHNVYHNALDVVTGCELGENTVCLIIGPFFHMAAVSQQLIPTLYVGGTNICVSTFDPKSVLEIIEREKVTFNYTVPTMLFRILDHEDINKYNLSRLHIWGYGAAPMPLVRLKQAIEIIGPILFQGYGTTEATGCVCMLRREDHRLKGTESQMKRLLSVGREFGNHELRVVDSDGNSLPPGIVGEAVIRSDSVMEGYWQNPEATHEIIKDGWLYTGDLAFWDEEHYIYLVDRKHDMIISGGENIYPKEVENVIYQHPAVLEAAVVGVPHPDWGEVPKAFITLKPGKTVSENEIIEMTRADLAHYKCPKSVQFLSEIPKTASGKISRSALKRLYVDF